MPFHTAKVPLTIPLPLPGGTKTGIILAQLEHTYLIEYYYDARYHWTSLIFLDQPDTLRRNPYGYYHLPLKWLRALIDQGSPWRGTPSSGPVPQPRELLAIRKVPHFLDDWHLRPDGSWLRVVKGHVLQLNPEGTPGPRARGGKGWSAWLDGKPLGLLPRGPSVWVHAAKLAYHVVKDLPPREYPTPTRKEAS